MSATTAATQWVYDFAEGSRDMRELLGGKGANVAEMTRVLGAERVPAGFTITTDACVAYMQGGRQVPDGLDAQVAEALGRLEEHAGRRLGDPSRPAARLRPLGRPRVHAGHARHRPQPRAQRRVRRRPGRADGQRALRLGLLPALRADVRQRRARHRGRALRGRDQGGQAGPRRHASTPSSTSTRCASWSATFQGFYDFPADPQDQLRGAITAVFDSWMGDRAVAYRRINRIPDEWGTAVNVQQMVFGNKGDTSGSGVAFSRDEVTGAPEPSGDFLVNAQGEDVVSGVRNTQDIADLAELMPEVHAELMEILRTLERHYGDMQDTEFTVEEGRLYMLQTRSAKRPAQAAVRFAVDAVAEGLLDKAQAIATIDAEKLDALLHPTFDPQADFEVLARGVAASPGAAKGEIVFTAAERRGRGGRRPRRRSSCARSPRPTTSPASTRRKGILTSEGGKASHAALVARGMGVPAVTGRERRWRSTSPPGEVRTGDVTLRAGDRIAIDGTTGAVTTADVPLVEPEMDERFEQVLAWSDELRRLGVRANADTPEDARRAREFGAAGIGLCRTEHMFFGPERHERMVQVILGRGRADARRPASTSSCRCSRATSRACSRRWRACRSPSGCSTRRCTSSCPARADVQAEVERARDGALGRPAAAGAHAGARLGARGGQPDARHARLPARDPLPGDLRDAGRRDHARRAGGARADGAQPAPRGDDPARRLRARAAAPARPGRARRRARGAAARARTTRSGR